MKFFPEKEPFPSWMGPYSPARGRRSGFRITDGRLGAWMSSGDESMFCPAVDSDGVSALTHLVVNSRFGGGRVLFLPSGIVVKPLQDEQEVGLRVVIGRYEGGFKLQVENKTIDLSSNDFVPGGEWPGPSTIGLECAIQPDGSLVTRWKHPTDYGNEEPNAKITPSNPTLLADFKKARPADTGGRVRVTVCGHAITNNLVGDAWKPYYLGKIETSQHLNWEKWIRRGET